MTPPPLQSNAPVISEPAKSARLGETTQSFNVFFHFLFILFFPLISHKHKTCEQGISKMTSGFPEVGINSIAFY